VITQKELKDFLFYDLETGIFIWLISNSNCVRVGDVAGGKRQDGYISIAINKKDYLAHRLAWFYVYGVWPDFIDHINHDNTDNRIANLRNVSHKENMRNQKLRSTNSSGVSGVSWAKTKKRWVAYITVDGRRIYLHGSEDKFEAICARKSAEKKHGFHANHGL
jgi:hypothetical protein